MRPRPDPIGPGQESVRSYLRPALAERTNARLVIEHCGRIVADTRSAIRALETHHPPGCYIPRGDGDPAIRRFLHRTDNVTRGRSIQGYSGQPRLVTR